MKAQVERIAAKTISRKMDRIFCKRVWSTPDQVYLNRLRAIGFEKMDKVMDAGSGLGQWSFALSKLNNHIAAIEFSKERVAFSNEMKRYLKVSNIDFINGSFEETPFVSDHFDAIFAYSSILYADYRRSLKEFYRILKPGGLLYFNSNGIGWYLHNLMDTAKRDEGFSIKQMAIDAMINSLNYYSLNKHEQGKSIITSKTYLLEFLREQRFTLIAYGGEGTVCLNKSIEIKPFFKESYHGHEGVIEFIVGK